MLDDSGVLDQPTAVNPVDEIHPSVEPDAWDRDLKAVRNEPACGDKAAWPSTDDRDSFRHQETLFHLPEIVMQTEHIRGDGLSRTR